MNIKLLFSIIGILLLICIIIGLLIHNNKKYSRTTNTTIESFDINDNYNTYSTVINNLNQLKQNIDNVSSSTSKFIMNNPISNPEISTNEALITLGYIKNLKEYDADAQFYVDQIIKEKKLELLRRDINNSLSLIPKPSLIPGMKNENIYGSIKNPLTGTNLNIDKINPTNNDSKYVVYINGKCLSYDVPSDPINRYSLQDCRKDNVKQQFNLNNIQSINDYNNIISNSLSSYKMNNNTSSENDNINSFYVVNPIENNEGGNKECLGIKNGDITIEPCNLTTYQRFNANARTLKC